MRAIVARHSGGPEALQIEEAPLPETRPGWVRIRVQAIGLSRSELYARRGDYPEVAFPRILGTECAGVVDDAGPEAPLRVGQTVVAVMGGMGRLYDGCYAEYALAPITHVMPLSTDLPWDALAALPKSYLTAQGALETLDLRAGQSMLIRGATSSVGMAALTLGKELGATVIATTRNPEKLETLRAAGADQTLVDAGAIEEDTRSLAPRGVDALLELVGAATTRDSLLVMAPKGILCYMGALGDSMFLERLQPLADIPSGVRLTAYASRETINAERCAEALQRIVDGVSAGRYPTHLDRVFPFEQIAAAHRYMEESRAAGKVVVTLHDAT